MTQIVLGIATYKWDGWIKCVDSMLSNCAEIPPLSVEVDMPVLEAFDRIYKTSLHPIIGYVHDDVMIYEKDWDVRVLKEFEDPTVGVVGFGGALGHGTPDLYTSPYRLPNLARQNFMSNMRSAETHGARFTGERDVAILDGFALFVRRPILDKTHGWPIYEPLGYWLYSEWVCCQARRQGYRIRLVGVDCEHLGGKSSAHIPTSPTYDEAHKYLYDTNRDVLPFRVRE